MISNTQHEFTLRDLLRVIFRYKLVLIACLITIMTAVSIGLELRTPAYISSVKMLVTGKMQKDLEVQRSLGPGSLIETHMTLVRARPILARAVEALKLYQRPLDYERRYATRLKRVLIDRNVRKLKLQIDAMTPDKKRTFFFNKAIGELMGRIFMSPEGETSIFIISVSDYDAVTAGRIANVISRSYVIFDLEQQIAELQLTYGNKNETIKKLEMLIEKLEETLDGRILPAVEALGPASVKIISQAGLGTEMPIKPSKSAGRLAGFVLSIVLGFVLAFGFDFFDQTFKDPGDVKKYLNIPFLGSIPKRKMRDKLLIEDLGSVTRYTQSFQKLSNRIYLSMKENKIKSLLLTDVEGSEETIPVIANIGVYLSKKSGYRVLIIDADLHTDSISEIFKISDTAGLIDVLEGSIPFEDAVWYSGYNLTVMPAGKTVLNPVTLLESSAMSDVIKKAEAQYDIVLINCANIKNYSEAIILSSFTNSIAFVINEGKVRRQIVASAIIPLESEKVNIIGAVLNNYNYAIPEIIYRLT